MRKIRNFNCSLCESKKPMHQAYLRFWDKIKGIYDSALRVKIPAKVLICRACDYSMKRHGYSTLGVGHFKTYLAKPKPPIRSTGKRRAPQPIRPQHSIGN